MLRRGKRCPRESAFLSRPCLVEGVVRSGGASAGEKSTRPDSARCGTAWHLAGQWQYVQAESATLNWQQFSFYGTYAFEVFAIDENYADYLVSSRQDPQFLDEPRFHVEGGDRNLWVHGGLAGDLHRQSRRPGLEARMAESKQRIPTGSIVRWGFAFGIVKGANAGL